MKSSQSNKECRGRWVLPIVPIMAESQISAPIWMRGLLYQVKLGFFNFPGVNRFIMLRRMRDESCCDHFFAVLGPGEGRE